MGEIANMLNVIQPTTLLNNAKVNPMEHINPITLKSKKDLIQPKVKVKR